MDQELLKEIAALRAKLEAHAQKSTLRAQEIALKGAPGEMASAMARQDARGALYFAAANVLEGIERFEHSEAMLTKAQLDLFEAVTQRKVA